MNLPLALVALRALAVVPVAALVVTEHFAPAFAMFTVAALTDLLDGALARRLGQTTNLGALLDPVADKILVVGCLGALAVERWVEVWPVAAIAAREVAFGGLRLSGAIRGGAEAAGKGKTVLQYVAVAAVLAQIAFYSVEGPVLSFDLYLIGAGLLGAAAVVTVLSGAATLATLVRTRQADRT